MKITWLSHSGVLIETGPHRITIDPFLTGNEFAPLTAQDVACDFILLTHGHDDHVGDTADIAQRTGATIVGNYEIATHFEKAGLKTLGMYHGGTRELPFGRVKMVPAIHGSGYPGPDGNFLYLGHPAGLVLSIEGKNLYHAGDTCLFSDMALIPRRTPLDVAFLPIGDIFTMGIDEAVDALQLLEPRFVIPIHYNTWPQIRADTDAFSHAVRASTTAEPVVLPPGGVMEL